MTRSRGFFLAGVSVILVPTALFLYLVIPVLGSQSLAWTAFAYRLESWLPWLRGAGAMLLAGAWIVLLRRGRPVVSKLVGAVSASLLTGVGLYAPQIIDPASFYPPPEELLWEPGTTAAVGEESLVLGLSVHGEARAYPLERLIYHHLLEDEIGDEPFLVTYCGMCRTGRVFRPEVDGRKLRFRLMGAQGRNSFYRDLETGSWWLQANGKAVEGALKGTTLTEVPSEQMTLGRWLELHPHSRVLQPDPGTEDGFAGSGFSGFDRWRPGLGNGPPWQDEGGPRWQWVVGIRDVSARGWPWERLVATRLIQDRIDGLPVALVLAEDGQSFRAWDRRSGDYVVDLRVDRDVWVDQVTGSRFGLDGLAHGGKLDGRRLRRLQATQEYRHAFERFSGGEVVTSAP